jgi:hypothetical protein
MATVLGTDVTVPAANRAGTHDTRPVEFADVLMADDQWVREEFDALIAAGWGDDVPPGPEPLQGSRWPRRPGYEHRPTPLPRPNEPRRDKVAPSHQRGPPGGVVHVNKDFARSPIQGDHRCGPTRTGPPTPIPGPHPPSSCLVHRATPFRPADHGQRSPDEQQHLLGLVPVHPCLLCTKAQRWTPQRSEPAPEIWRTSVGSSGFSRGVAQYSPRRVRSQQDQGFAGTCSAQPCGPIL